MPYIKPCTLNARALVSIFSRSLSTLTLRPTQQQFSSPSHVLSLLFPGHLHPNLFSFLLHSPCIATVSVHRTRRLIADISVSRCKRLENPSLVPTPFPLTLTLAIERLKLTLYTRDREMDLAKSSAWSIARRTKYTIYRNVYTPLP